ncbi:helix-turn-helix transcriptional regulator [Cupriavidus sp. 2MCAB6]|uniref:helix-turn-helix transcriptional regulator n=1 Tax=Cupriavidus sp. 2MCAB6 TaxID=3232981 RepID=UPI003F8E7C5D
MNDLLTPDLDSISGLALTPTRIVPSAPACADGPIREERQWRCAPRRGDAGARQWDRVPVSRWTHTGATPLEVSHAGHDSEHCIGLSLRSMSVSFASAGRQVFDGRIASGAAQITAPGVPVNAVFTSASDVLHLFVSQAVLAECYADQFGHAHAGDMLLGDPRLVTNPTMERLGQALALAHSQDPGLGRIFCDSVGLAIVSRIVAGHFNRVAADARVPARLPAWRLRRVVEFIDAHLSDPIGLADIAGSAGLTRMHFAAQFRRATGLRPHEYLLRRRIEHAQELLRHADGNVLDVALRCGFRSQAHFTTVFKRFVGDTPYCWRVKTGKTAKAG